MLALLLALLLSCADVQVVVLPLIVRARAVARVLALGEIHPPAAPPSLVKPTIEGVTIVTGEDGGGVAVGAESSGIVAMPGRALEMALLSLTPSALISTRATAAAVGAFVSAMLRVLRITDTAAGHTARVAKVQLSFWCARSRGGGMAEAESSSAPFRSPTAARDGGATPSDGAATAATEELPASLIVGLALTGDLPRGVVVVSPLRRPNALSDSRKTEQRIKHLCCRSNRSAIHPKDRRGTPRVSVLHARLVGDKLDRSVGLA